MSKAEGSRICTELDGEVEAVRSRPIRGEHPYLWIDATSHKVRQDGRVQSMAMVVALGVTVDGERQVLGVDAGPSEDAAFWTVCLRSRVKRGRRGVRLVIADAHEGLKKALATGLGGASGPRGRVHFMRHLLATVPHGAREPVAALVRTIFAQPDPRSARAQLQQVADGLRPRFPQAAALLEDAAADILAHRHVPLEPRARLHSTTPRERLHKQVNRRSAVVGIFPNRTALLRLVGAILAEQDAEWAVADRRDVSAESMKQLTPPLATTSQEELLAAIA